MGDNEARRSYTVSIMVARFADMMLELGDIYDVLGDVYRAVAYHRAWYTVQQGTFPGRAKCDMLWEEVKSLLPLYVGQSVWEKWCEVQQTGQIEELNKLRVEPRVVAFRELESILGVGHQVARAWLDAGIMSISDLREAVKKRKVMLTHTQLLGLRHHTDLTRKIPRSEVQEIYAGILPALQEAHCSRCELVGSYRRGALSSGDVDILCCVNTHSAEQTLAVKVALENTKLAVQLVGWILTGEDRITLLARLPQGAVRQVDILLATVDEYPCSLLYFTGDKNYNIYMRKLAKNKGLLLNQRGLYKRGVALIVATEEDVFAKLGVAFVPPDKRTA